MTPHQRKILQEAPKFRYYYLPETRERQLIPDADNDTDRAAARKYALNWGATHFSARSFYRFEVDGQPSPHQFGDFYCRLTAQRFDALTAIRRMLLLAEALAFCKLRISVQQSVRFTYLGEWRLGMTIPAAVFGLEGGSPVLRDYYLVLAEEMRKWAVEFGFGDIEISHDDGIDVENCQLSHGAYAVPLMWDELAAMCEGGSLQAILSPRSAPSIAFRERINTEVHFDVMCEAKSRWTARRKAGGAPKREWPTLRPLIDDTGASACGSAHSEAAVKCAIKLLAGWFRPRGISEFRRQNALRAVGGSFTLDNGVADALQILMAHNYLQECPFPAYRYPGRRPSPWYLVNPAVF